MNRMTKMELRGLALFWAVVFATVPLMYILPYLEGRESGVNFSVILANWLELLPYLVLFCLHYFFLAPLFFKKKYTVYALTSLALFIAFCIYIQLTIIGPAPGEGPMPGGPDPGPGGPPGPHRPLKPEALKMALGALFIPVGLGIKAIYLSIENERRLNKLHAESMAQKLEMLRYQINPHFFMNTLNNIQALVLTEPEKATQCISEFSRLMRMVLSEGHTALIPLEKEIQYIGHYVSLMRLQLPETVEITFKKPKECGEAMVPALSLVSFVENAFKHGCKSKPGSFIRISVEVKDGRVVFRCSNKMEQMAIPVGAGEGGVGNDNVQTRLELLYGEDFTLECAEDGDVYRVLMSIPVVPEGGVQ